MASRFGKVAAWDGVRAAGLFMVMLMLAGPLQAAGFTDWLPMSRDMTIGDARVNYLQRLKQLKAGEHLDRDPAMVRRAERVAQRIVEAAVKRYPASASWDWEVHVAHIRQFNASCYPGGKILINDHVFNVFPADDAAIAFVLGHEVAHALLEHVRFQQSGQRYTAGLHWLMTRSFRVGRLGQELLDKGEMVTHILPMSRQQEMEADMLGLELSAAAGFDPAGAVRVTEVMRKLSEKTDQTTDLLTTHPLEARRVVYVTRHIETVLQGGAGKPETAGKATP